MTSQKDPRTFVFTGLKELLLRDKPKWLLYNWVPALGVTYAVGDTGTHKTHLSIALSGAVATPGMNFADLSTVHGQVIYVPLEDIDGFAEHVLAWALYYDMDDIPNLHILENGLSLLRDGDDFIAEVKRQYGGCPDNPIALIVIDPFGMATTGVSEVIKEKLDEIIGNEGVLERIWKAFHCAIFIPFHTNNNDEMRGSKLTSAYSSASLRIKRTRDGDIEISDIKRRRGIGTDAGLAKLYLEPHIQNLGYCILANPVDEEATGVVMIKSCNQAQHTIHKLKPLHEEILRLVGNLNGADVLRTDITANPVVAHERPMTISRAFDFLEKSNYIACFPDSTDKRKQRVSFTTDGQVWFIEDDLHRMRID